MEDNIVKAAWILGGSILASVLIAGAGTLYLSHSMAAQFEISSKRAADAIMQAPRNTTVGFRQDAPVIVGFDTKLPMAVRVENSMDEKRQTRAVFEVEVKPTLNK